MNKGCLSSLVIRLYALVRAIASLDVTDVNPKHICLCCSGSMLRATQDKAYALIPSFFHVAMQSVKYFVNNH